MNYYYLASSLPMLEFDAKPLVSFADFLSRCREQLSDTDAEIIDRAGLGPFEDTKDDSYTLKEWKEFDTGLRNELVRHRAHRLGKDASMHIRDGKYIDPFLSGHAHWAVSQESLLDSELYLDQLRWEKIEGLEKGHYFDIDFLICYALKLQIVERWQRVKSERSVKLLG